MRKNTFCAANHISALNIFRISQGDKAFTREHLKRTLKDGGIPSNEVFVSALRRSPILTQVGKDQFKFANPSKPIYYGWLDRVYKDYKSKTDMYYNNAIKKKGQIA